jgi:hypothetical protein
VAINLNHLMSNHKIHLDNYSEHIELLKEQNDLNKIKTIILSAVFINFCLYVLFNW